MNSEALFTLALGLNPPWEVRKVELVALPGEHKELHIEIDFQKGPNLLMKAERPVVFLTRYQGNGSI
jgi:hypothetical protein